MRSCLLALVGTAALPAPAGAANDLHALVERWRRGDAAAVEAELVGWSLPRARAAARDVGKGGRWPDPWVLGAALLCTHVARDEIQRGLGPGTGWLALADQVLGRVADEPLRRRWRRDWRLALAAFHARRYDGRRARDVLDQAALEFPGDPDVLFAAGRMHEAIGARFFSGLAEPVSADFLPSSERDLLEAERLYGGVLEARPAHALARLRRGRVLALLGRPRSARSEIERVLASSPDPDLSCLAHLFLGAMAENGGEQADALSAYRAAVSTGRSPEVAPLALAHLLERAGDAAAARRAVEEILATTEDPSGPGDAWWLYLVEGLGEASGEEGRFESLREEARR
ncbi:MAG TPA: tetratricopeptide repeat protein [Vicinamibacteria bacterium]